MSSQLQINTNNSSTLVQEQQIVLILVGLIGSGKSTFAQALETHLPQFRRCNQDELGDRRRVEELARQSLRQGLSICVDRTNVDAAQRSHWINIAREVPETAIWVLVFDTPYKICVDRLRQRVNHPTIKTPEQGLQILARFSSSFQWPSPQEGYDRIMNLRPSDHPSSEWTSQELVDVLERLRESQSVIPDGQTQTLPQFWGSRRTSSDRGRSYRGYTRGHSPRGRGYRGHAPPAYSSVVDANWSDHRSQGNPDYNSHPRANRARASWNNRGTQPPLPQGHSRFRPLHGQWRSVAQHTPGAATAFDPTQMAVDRQESSPQLCAGDNAKEPKSSSGGASSPSGRGSGSGTSADPLVLG
ncbi:P-loop containing nucleoside triphosphate hydrolase protein [Heliocybe sulcata]|uniref:P-loop containing nucleoside triphosphate hydrolase protein n=1 Tax=Heliocybe sulcata TaxID=5364 RepID=A0A5C3N6G6_9AGAM|nr:P-loop containing nucleoside triphosphate hydrolase protein [Heliocybe sulcata]